MLMNGMLRFIKKLCCNYGVGWAELVEAAQQGHTEDILRILNKDPELVYTLDVAGETVLHVLARAGHARAAFKMMHFISANRLENVLLKKNIDGDTALHLALKYKHRKAAFWLAAGFGKIAVYGLNKDGISPWDLAEEDGCSGMWSVEPLAGVADIEMRLATMDIDSEELYKLKWIDGSPIGVRAAFLQASAYGVIRAKQIQCELDRFGGNLLHIAARLGNVDILSCCSSL